VRHSRVAAIVVTSFLTCAALAPLAALAAEAPAPGPLVSTWVIWPKAGEQAAFEAGLKAHAAWRKSAGEGWHWNIYTPVVGKDLDCYVIRAEGLHWADLDKETAWEESSGSFAKYMEQAGVHAAHAEHYLSMHDMENSMWTDNPAYKYFGVTVLVPREGMHEDIAAGVAKIHKALAAKKWSHSYGLEWRIGGSEALFFVEPFVNYAGMADPDPSLMKVLGDALGKDAAAATMKQLQASFASNDYTIYVLRPDLSTPK